VRRWLTAILLALLFIATTVLVVIGLKDLDLLVAIASRLIVVAVIIGIPVMILKTLLFPRKKED
jgi:uncharacterized membrane protein